VSCVLTVYDTARKQNSSIAMRHGLCADPDVRLCSGDKSERAGLRRFLQSETGNRQAQAAPASQSDGVFVVHFRETGHDA